MADNISLSTFALPFGSFAVAAASKCPALLKTFTISNVSASIVDIYLSFLPYGNNTLYETTGFHISDVSAQIQPGESVTKAVSFNSQQVGNAVRTYTAQLYIIVTNEAGAEIEQHNIQCSITLTADTSISTPTTTTAPASCDQPAALCPTGYSAAPNCPVDTSLATCSSPVLSSDGTCTPPVSVPPPGPPSEKTVSGFIYNSDSAALYGNRQESEYQSDLIETPLQAQRVAEQIIWQSNQVIQAQWSIPFNPEIFKGRTIRLKSDLEGVDMTGIVKNVGHQFDVKNGLATTQIVALFSEFTFNSQIDEPLDLRA